MTFYEYNKLPLVTLPELIGNSGFFSDGDWVESKDQDPNGDVRLVQLADVGIGEFLDKSDRFMTSDKAAKLRCSFLKAGDVLIARMPDPIGRACLFPGDTKPCVTVVDVCILRPDPKIVDSNWLLHNINSPIFSNEITKWVTGTTRQRISRGNLSKISFPLPPLPEQKRIAAILDKADNIRRKRHQAIELADEFLRATFLDMFGDLITNSKGWKQRKFCDVCIINPKPEKNVKFNRSSFVSFVPMACVDEKRGQIMNSAKKTYAEVAKGYTFFKNSDVLMAKITPCMENGKAAIAENLINGLGFGSTEFHVLRPQSKVTPEYIFSFIHREPFRLEAKSRFTGTAGQQRVPTSFLKDYEIPVPSIDLQNKFSTFFKKIRKIRQKSEFLIDRNAYLFSSLTQKAFRGEL